MAAKKRKPKGLSTTTKIFLVIAVILVIALVIGGASQTAQFSRVVQPGQLALPTGIQAPACTRGVPTITISPTSQTGSPGQTLFYTFALKNTDSAGCQSTLLEITYKFPQGGITGVIDKGTTTIKPGRTYLANEGIKSFSNTTPGSYTFTVNLRNTASNLSSSASAVYVVSGGGGCGPGTGRPCIQ